jgi:hypothetical protein
MADRRWDTLIQYLVEKNFLETVYLKVQKSDGRTLLKLVLRKYTERAV